MLFYCQPFITATFVHSHLFQIGWFDCNPLPAIPQEHMILHVQHAVHQHAARTTLASDASIIAEYAPPLGSLFISETAAFAFPV